MTTDHPGVEVDTLCSFFILAGFIPFDVDHGLLNVLFIWCEESLVLNSWDHFCSIRLCIRIESKKTGGQ